jgi:uncharacterized protein (DUF58 family)
MPVEARVLRIEERDVHVRHRRGALDLARRLPPLVVAARQVAANVVHGVHGRRRAGIGESFWQFRPFVSGENAAAIDWRRSARDDRTYVREREWEAAQTIWLWIDCSPSMAYQSSLATQSKLDRALMLGLAAADLLVRGGERVGLHGLTRAFATRAVVERLAEALAHRDLGNEEPEELPRPITLPARSRAVLFGDFLSDKDLIAERITSLAAGGAVGEIVLIADPIEETFPFEGHVELRDVDSAGRLRLGEARSLASTYMERLAAHRDAIRAVARAHGWNVVLHRTDQSAAPALLGLAGALGDMLQSGAG